MTVNSTQRFVSTRRLSIAKVLPFGLLLLAGCAGNSMTADANYNQTGKDGYHARSNSVGYKALETGKYADAVAYYEAANRETPNQPYYELNLAAAYQRQGRMAEAEPLLRLAILHGGDVNPTYWTTDLAQDRTVAEIACQNLEMGLAAATMAGTAAKCQRTEIAALAPTPRTAAPVAAPATMGNPAIDYFTQFAAVAAPPRRPTRPLLRRRQRARRPTATCTSTSTRRS
jgi:tetratricopeptide (TPR) repeat protein